MTAPRVLVAGVGNVLFGDDGFGCEVAGRLSRCPLPESVSVVDFGIRAFDLGCALAEGHDLAILVDAMSRGGPPGTLYVIEPLLSPAGALDAHTLSPATALDLAAALGGRPAEVRVIGCEPGTFGPEGEGCLGLSAEVEAAVDEAVAMTMAMALAALSAEPESGQARREVQRMNGFAIGYGAALVALGVGGYVATSAESKTALIPAGFGAAEIALGLLGQRRAATVVGVMAFAGAARGLAKLPALLRGQDVARPAAVVAQSVMAGLSAAYVVGALLGRSR